MGIMAYGAALRLHRVVTVGCFEATALAVMTTKAQLRFSGSEQVLVIGTMGGMTCPAALIKEDLMYHFFLVFFLFVALVTCSAPLTI